MAKGAIQLGTAPSRRGPTVCIGKQQCAVVVSLLHWGKGGAGMDGIGGGSVGSHETCQYTTRARWARVWHVSHVYRNVHGHVHRPGAQ